MYSKRKNIQRGEWWGGECEGGLVQVPKKVTRQKAELLIDVALAFINVNIRDKTF